VTYTAPSLRYCQRCILPDTRPGLELDAEGICSACRAHRAARTDIDWDARGACFEKLAERVKALARPYDCLVPVSGGKDSHWQTIKCLEAGLHPLAVTWKTPGRTDLGQANLTNLIELGVDHLDAQINPRVERKFMYRTLVEVGSTAVPMHLAIFSIPMTIAAKLEIPLIVWGENSAREYVGDAEDGDSERLDSAWVAKYGVVHGTTARDWVSDDLTASELTPYFAPDEVELERKGVEGVFLGQFFQWDPELAYEAARARGFQAASGGARTGTYEYADVDDDFISVHHWIKWLKFGFTRSYDNLSLEIRNGRISREQAIETIARLGDETPLGDIESVCAYLGISVERFFEVVETFRNQDVWRSDEKGRWVIEDFLIEDWDWDGGPAGSAGRAASRGGGLG